MNAKYRDRWRVAGRSLWVRGAYEVRGLKNRGEGDGFAVTFRGELLVGVFRSRREAQLAAETHQRARMLERVSEEVA